jgi:hypothetical protein
MVSKEDKRECKQLVSSITEKTQYAQAAAEEFHQHRKARAWFIGLGAGALLIQWNSRGAALNAYHPYNIMLFPRAATYDLRQLYIRRIALGCNLVAIGAFLWSELLLLHWSDACASVVAHKMYSVGYESARADQLKCSYPSLHIKF